MSTRLPASTDSTNLYKLMADWHRTLREYDLDAVAVLGPDVFSVAGTRRVLAAYPVEATPAAAALAGDAAIGGPWERLGAPVVAWQHLARPLSEAPADDESSWRAAWRRRGAQTVLCIGFALPAARAFECFLFSRRELDDRADVAALAWSVLSIWPVLRAALVAMYNPLTPRELQCLSLAFDGLTARASAERMACTERTVNFHLANAMAKLSADNKMAAIQRACWLGAL